MFGSSALDVAIGLAFLYLVLGLLCTTINEFIETLLRKRAKDLEWGIRELLGGEQAGAWLRRLYEHPFVFSLFDGEYAHRGRNLPGYIPSKTFALALLDLVLPAGANKSGAARATAKTPAPGAPVVVNVPAAGGAVPPLPLNPDAALIADLRAAVLATQNVVIPFAPFPDKLRESLLALIDAAGDDMNKVRENIENWFDGTMDRVSGWYRRRIQWISGAVGLSLAIFLNADTFAVADSLARDPTLRASVSTAAEAYVKAHPPAPDPKLKEKDASEGAAKEKEKGAKEKDAKEKDAKGKEKPDVTLNQVAREINSVREYGWPLGWDRDDRRTIPRIGKDDNEWRAIGAWLLKALGWVLTATAISLGAPFWFDLLNRLIVVRSTVKPTEKSPPEQSADKK